MECLSKTQFWRPNLSFTALTGNPDSSGIPAWTNHYDFMDGNPGPRCDVWWNDSSYGLEKRNYDHIIKKTENPDHDFALVAYVGSDNVDSTVRRFLLKEPPPSKFGADMSGDGAQGDWLGKTVGYVGGAVAYPAIKAPCIWQKQPCRCSRPLPSCAYISRSLSPNPSRSSDRH